MTRSPRYLYVHADRKDGRQKVHEAIDLLLDLNYTIHIVDEGVGVAIYYADPNVYECFEYDDGSEDDDYDVEDEAEDIDPQEEE